MCYVSLVYLLTIFVGVVLLSIIAGRLGMDWLDLFPIIFPSATVGVVMIIVEVILYYE